MQSDILNRLKEIVSESESKQRTHYDGCWAMHTECALALAVEEIETLRDELAHSDDVIVKSTDENGEEVVILTVTGEDATMLRDAAIGEYLEKALREMIEESKNA